MSTYTNVNSTDSNKSGVIAKQGLCVDGPLRAEKVGVRPQAKKEVYREA